MNITLSGYGRMGKEIEKAAVQAGHHISARLDQPGDWERFDKAVRQSEVIIDFSLPQAVLGNIHKAFEIGLPIVVGTTGWYDEMESIKQECLQKQQCLIWASNFSVGVNIFFRLNQHLAEMMSHHEQYQAQITEIHHTGKLDSPSGTAITLANHLLKEIPQLQSWTNTAAGDNKTLAIESKRIPHVPGTHIVHYRSNIDEIEIKHSARSREGFARGAVLAAEKTTDLKGFYNFADLIFNSD